MSKKVTSREFAKSRTFLEKKILLLLKLSLKQYQWKKSSNFFYTFDDQWFWVATVSVFTNSENVNVSLETKPMGLDPILWDIFGIPENIKKPKSFRSNGAFTCSSIPVSSLDINVTQHNIEECLLKIEIWLIEAMKENRKIVNQNIFSNLLLQHENQKQRGAYAISLVCALINEGKNHKALEFAKAYEDGKLESVFCMTNTDSNSFHYHAIKWLNRNT